MEGARRFVSLARHRAVAAFCRAILEDPRRDLRAECKFDDGRTAVTGDNSFFSFFFERRLDHARFCDFRLVPRRLWNIESSSIRFY